MHRSQEPLTRPQLDVESSRRPVADLAQARRRVGHQLWVVGGHRPIRGECGAPRKRGRLQDLLAEVRRVAVRGLFVRPDELLAWGCQRACFRGKKTFVASIRVQQPCRTIVPRSKTYCPLVTPFHDVGAWALSTFVNRWPSEIVRHAN